MSLFVETTDKLMEILVKLIAQISKFLMMVNAKEKISVDAMRITILFVDLIIKHTKIVVTPIVRELK